MFGSRMATQTNKQSERPTISPPPLPFFFHFKSLGPKLFKNNVSFYFEKVNKYLH